MRFSGKVVRVGRFWHIEVPDLNVRTQGHTKKEAYEMIADAIESLVDRDGFQVGVYPGHGDYFEIDANDQATLFAFFLRQQRESSGVRLTEAARRLGQSSPNAYARYEQGKSVPTIAKLDELLAAVGTGKFVLRRSELDD